MSASIRIKIMGGTSLLQAYEDCAAVSKRLGGISVRTSLNGVEMFYHGQILSEWINDFYDRLYGVEEEEGGAE